MLFFILLLKVRAIWLGSKGRNSSDSFKPIPKSLRPLITEKRLHFVAKVGVVVPSRVHEVIFLPILHNKSSQVR